jgi:hypothetical protein
VLKLCADYSRLLVGTESLRANSGPWRYKTGRETTGKLPGAAAALLRVERSLFETKGVSS